MTVSRQALAVLDLIEAIEMRSLEWGFTDGSLSEDEVIALADSATDPNGAEAGEDLLEELVSAKLVLELQSVGSGVRIRSRFAEMMRLLVTNRQLFPNKPWQGAPRLVADFRVDRRARRFPRRNRMAADIVAESGTALAKTDLARELWIALVGSLKLSAFQERAVIRLSDAKGDCGTIVTAGTGSGKTLAFYVPAMLRIGELLGDSNWVKAIAIYPRVELLKDQFAEAFRMARAIDSPLQKFGRRSIKLGVLFAATPRRANRQELIDSEAWRRRGADFICPWMRCLKCDGELLWSGPDIDAGVERLRCTQHDCADQISEDHVVLTRTRLQQEPPDILFTTTEILNQRLSDHWMRVLFGIGVPAHRKPVFALLDEVHTYEGASGAQTALTLRRWRHLLETPVNWVGLSATLGDAARFFSDLTGTHLDNVVEIKPSFDEHEEEGAEYQILLRGDPASRASLLSSTIQTSMLVPRVLDPPNATDASGAFGRRAFLFTDDLDVTNRLYDDLRDAEAFTIFGKPDPQRVPLANLRRGGPDAALRDVEGQRWRICEDIGHPLDQRLIVGRTTSQDGGVNNTANIIVATASLEVGFNDPLVGAVIQHKAPRSMASFLQRKGRAGRTRIMRPILLTILSDYGRDRAFYQSFEHLFDPALEPQYLPVRNPYVLKIQAVFALFDWLASRTAGYEKAWQWDILSRPQSQPSEAVRAVLHRSRTKLTELVRGDAETVADLRNYIIGALAIDDATADSLLWEGPRSVLLEAVPTLTRRLFRQWQLAFPSQEGDHDLYTSYHPLPDFVPRNLFSDLSLPEVNIIIPPATVNHEERTETMPILQALNQLVPGRVSRRFAPERGSLSHWVPLDPALPEQERRISDYAEVYEGVGTFTGRLNDPLDAQSFLVFRPWTVRLAKVARTEALPSSNARLIWRTDIVANGEPLNVPVPLRSQWRSYVNAVGFYLHRFRSSVCVRRFAPTAHANVRTLQDEFAVTVSFKNDDDRPAALGFELEVDGVRLDVALPEAGVFNSEMLPPPLMREGKLNYLRDTFRADPNVPADVNDFQRDWLVQLLLSAVLAEASTTERSIKNVIDDILGEERLEAVFNEVMNEQFGAVPPGIQEDDDPDDAEGLDEEKDSGSNDRSGRDTGSHRARSSRLQQGLTAQLARPVVRERLRALAVQIETPDPPTFNRWLRKLVLETLGEAALQACIAAAPRQATIENLLVDIHDDPVGNVATIWITETTLGGAGVLEAFAERFATDPRVFFTALEAALVPTDLELVDESLKEILKLALANSDIADLVARLRATNSHSERAILWQTLSHHLANFSGIDLSHALSVSINNRLLRSGSGPQLDQLLLNLQDHWTSCEERFQLSIGLREFAYIASKDTGLANAVRAFLTATLPAAAIGHVTVLAAIGSLLWPRASEIRQRALQSYNPYRKSRPTDPGIVRHLLLRKSIPTVHISSPEWRTLLQDALATHGSCQLAAVTTRLSDLRRAVINLVASPIDIGTLQFFPLVERIERMSGGMLVTLTLREQV